MANQPLILQFAEIKARKERLRMFLYFYEYMLNLKTGFSVNIFLLVMVSLWVKMCFCDINVCRILQILHLFSNFQSAYTTVYLYCNPLKIVSANMIYFPVY